MAEALLWCAVAAADFYLAVPAQRPEPVRRLSLLLVPAPAFPFQVDIKTGFFAFTGVFLSAAVIRGNGYPLTLLPNC
jgi:hypothetical protein